MSDPRHRRTPQHGTVRTERGRWLGLAFLSLGVAMIIVDATIVNVAIPSIIRDLDITIGTAEWVNTIYALVFAALLITLGRAGDLLGRRRLFIAGVVLFVGASLLAGRAPNGGLLILARTVQGIGGATILPATLSSVNATFTGRDRAIAFGVWGSVIGGMAAVGPLLGGWLTTAHSWRWAFYINVPIGLAAVLGALRFVPETRDEDVVRGINVPGVVMSVLGFGGLVFGLIEGQTYGWVRPTRPFVAGGWTWPLASVSVVAVAFALAVVMMAAFPAAERRRRAAGRFVLLDVTLFRIRSFAVGNVTAIIVSLGEFGLLFVLPLFLQGVLGYSAFRTGLVFLALATGAFLAGPSAAQLAQRVGPRPVVSLGMALEAAAILGVGLTVSVASTGWTLAPWLLVYGVGVGLATAQLTNVILADVPPRESGQASGVQSTSRQVGSALGIAILGTALVVSLSSATSSRLAQVPGLPPAAAEQITTIVRESGGAAIGALRSQPGAEAVVGEIDLAFVAAFRRVAFLASLFVGLGFLASLALPNRREAATSAPDATSLEAVAGQ